MTVAVAAVVVVVAMVVVTLAVVVALAVVVVVVVPCRGGCRQQYRQGQGRGEDRKSTRLNSSHQIISYAVFCLKKKNYRNLGNRQVRHTSLRAPISPSETSHSITSIFYSLR